MCFMLYHTLRVAWEIIGLIMPDSVSQNLDTGIMSRTAIPILYYIIKITQIVAFDQNNLYKNRVLQWGIFIIFLH